MVVCVGGCYVEGQRMANAFWWRDLVALMKSAPGTTEMCGRHYWSDDGFGYFEGLQVCSKPRAEP
jgi:alpha-N-arabinofuranosidase